MRKPDLLPDGTVRIRRKKPWYRARNIVLGAVALLALLVGREVYRALTARPGNAVDYGAMAVALPDKYLPEGVSPTSRNGWDLVIKAMGIIQTMNEEMRARASAQPQPFNQDIPHDFTIEYSWVHPQTYDPEHQARIHQRNLEALDLVRAAGLFELLDELARTPRAARAGQEGKMVGWLLPELGSMRNTARLNKARMKWAVEAGDGDEWVRIQEQTLALGRVAQQQSFLIDRLVGIAICALVNSEINAGLIERKWDEATLVKCLEAFDRQNGWVPPIDQAIEGERIAMLDIMQWAHTDDGHGDGRLILTSMRDLGGFVFGGAQPVVPGLSGFEGLFDELMDLEIGNMLSVAYAGKKASTRKANEILDLAQQHSKALPRERENLKDLDKAVEDLSPRYAIVKMVTPSLGKTLQSWDQHQVQTAGTRVAIVLEIYRARHGAYPESLSALAPEFYPSVPLDPFTGGPWGYRLLENDPDGRGYLLYTFGRDGQDNEGVAPKGNLPTPLHHKTNGVGFDWVINEPREKPTPEELKEAADFLKERAEKQLRDKEREREEGEALEAQGAAEAPSEPVAADPQ